MTIWNRFVLWLIARAKRTPYFHLEGYMERYWLVPYDASGTWSDVNCGPASWWRQPIARVLQLFGIAARVHHILRSDEGRDPHDHPWSYLTVILMGGYFEERFDDEGRFVSVRWHGPGSVLWRPANSWHKLIVPQGQTAWTLFITGRKQATWGFNVAGVKVPHREYLRGE